MKKFLSILLMTALPALGQPLDDVLARWDRDEHPDLRSVLVMRDGAIIAERYYNGETADTLRDIRSAAKGTALQGVTLDQILTMRSGLAAFDEDPASPGNEDKMDDAADPVAFVLAVPAETTPGTRYRYNSLTSYVAGITIEQATGKDLEAFARETLFTPLGIQHLQWLRDAANHPKGQGNLFLRTRDLASIGQMVLDQGMYQGRRVISAEWIQAALAPRVAIGDVDRYADHYGYFWYQKKYDDTVVHFASGNGGNKIYVIPSRKEVVIVSSSAYGKGYGQRRSAAILQAILDAKP
jgi:CubicO group peptidase (beta-lactamase class C family)